MFNGDIVYDDSTEETRGEDGVHLIRNRHLQTLSHDVLYHLALNTQDHDLPRMFGDVKFICVGGTAKRMKNFATYVSKEMGMSLPVGAQLEDITLISDRYSMFKVGPVLSVSHGMGISSLSILMHELIKLVYYAKCKDVIFFRIGTSGGIGLEPGTVVITERAVDELLRPHYELHILGKVVNRPAVCDHELADELKSIADQEISEFATVKGTTMCALDFYESQGRLDGAFCNFTQDEKMNYLYSLRDAGVVNIEMEATTFMSMTHYAGIRAAIICVTVLNRLNGDQITHSKEFLEQLQKRPQILAAKFIKRRLANANKS